MTQPDLSVQIARVEVRNEERHAEQLRRLDRIEAKVDKTNGRVTVLEKRVERADGAADERRKLADGLADRARTWKAPIVAAAVGSSATVGLATLAAHLLT